MVGTPNNVLKALTYAGFDASLIKVSHCLVRWCTWWCQLVPTRSQGNFEGKRGKGLGGAVTGHVLYIGAQAAKFVPARYACPIAQWPGLKLYKLLSCRLHLCRWTFKLRRTTPVAGHHRSMPTGCGPYICASSLW